MIFGKGNSSSFSLKKLKWASHPTGEGAQNIRTIFLHKINIVGKLISRLLEKIVIASVWFQRIRELSSLAIQHGLTYFIWGIVFNSGILQIWLETANKLQWFQYKHISFFFVCSLNERTLTFNINFFQIFFL